MVINRAVDRTKVVAYFTCRMFDFFLKSRKKF